MARLEVVEWSMPVRGDMWLAGREGAPLSTVATYQDRPGISFTAWLRWDGFVQLAQDIHSDALHPVLEAVLTRAWEVLGDYLDQRASSGGPELLAAWKDEGSYPYDSAPVGTAEIVERELFDIVAVTAAPARLTWSSREVPTTTSRTRSIRHSRATDPCGYVPVMIDDLLDTVDSARVLAASAALQMDSANAPELPVLQRLSHFALRRPPALPGPALSASAVRRLLRCDQVGGDHVLAQLDPFEGLPVCEVVIASGRYRVPVGLAGSAPVVAERLLRAVLNESSATLPTAYRARVHHVAEFILGLSDLLCRRFERLPDEADPVLTRKVTVPSAARLAELADHVVFSPDELFEALTPDVAHLLEQEFVQPHAEPRPPGGTEDLDTPTENPRWADELGVSDPQPFPWQTDGPGADGLLEHGALVARPIVHTHLGLVVAAPTELAATLRHFIIVDAIRHRCIASLLEAVAGTAVDDAGFWLDTITDSDLVLVQPSRPEIATTRSVAPDAASTGCTARLIAPFDDDKMLDVRIVVDDLRGYDVLRPWGRSRMPPIDVPALGHPTDKTLVVNLQFGLGRSWLSRGPASGGPQIHATLEDIITVLHTPGADTMTLWYFVEAHHRANESTTFMAFSPTDLFSTYLDHRESFYVSDDARSLVMAIEVGTGQTMRRRAARVAGPQFTPFGHGTARSTGCQDELSPVATVLGDTGVCFANLADTTLWSRCVMAPSTSDLRTPADQAGIAGPDHLDEARHHMAQSITYWLWQLHLECPGLLKAASPDNDLLVQAHMSLPPNTDATSHRQSSGTTEPRTLTISDTTQDWVNRHPGAAPGTLVRGRPMSGFVLEVRPPAPAGHHDAPNVRDRQLVAVILDGLIDLAQRSPSIVDDQGPQWSSQVRGAVVDAVAPPGHKRLMDVVTSNDSPVYWPGNLPRAIKVRPTVVARVLDRVGKHLSDRGHRPGPIPRQDRGTFLNDSVITFLIDWLNAEISDLDATSALPVLAHCYEALLHESATQARDLPAQLACFGPGSSSVEDLRRGRQRTTETSIALRFLIELISGSSPNGAGTLNQERTDLLIALATEIVNKGLLSDVLSLGLGDHGVSVLRSGRLGIDRDHDLYSEALASFSADISLNTHHDAMHLAQQAHPDTTTRTTTTTSDTKDATGTTDAASPSDDGLDVLAAAEYGFSYTTLAQACAGLIDHSVDMGQVDLGVLEVDAARDTICNATGLTETHADHLVSKLTLTALGDFWAAGADVFPWRFNRDRIPAPAAATPATPTGRRRAW